jgi:predicted RNA-binding protein
MCEFNVVLNGKIQFKDVVYAKIQGNTVIVKTCWVKPSIANSTINEVDVNSAKLILQPTK